MSGYSDSAATCMNISMLCRLKLLAASINEPQINAAVVRAVAMRQCAFKSVRWRADRISFLYIVSVQRLPVANTSTCDVSLTLRGPLHCPMLCIGVYGIDGAYNNVK